MAEPIVAQAPPSAADEFSGLPHMKSVLPTPRALSGDWTFSLRKTGTAGFRSLKAADIGNAYLVLGYVIG
jgi:hypothetical protein